MICKHCQTANDSDARFCKQCAHPLTEPCPDDMTVQEQNFPMTGWENAAKKKSKDGKKWIVIVVAAVLIAAVVLAAMLANGYITLPGGEEAQSGQEQEEKRTEDFGIVNVPTITVVCTLCAMTAHCGKSI